MPQSTFGLDAVLGNSRNVRILAVALELNKQAPLDNQPAQMTKIDLLRHLFASKIDAESTTWDFCMHRHLLVGGLQGTAKNWVNEATARPLSM